MLKARIVHVILLFTCLFLANRSAAQPPLFKSPVYIYHYSENAIQQMVEHRIPASVTLAQAIFESNCGTSDLAKKSNNHFGIKCHYEWGGDTIVKTDDEENECFRKYNNVSESYLDHSLFLKSRVRYAPLFQNKILDYKSWCYGLKAAGYATYPAYAEELIKIIEENNLFEFDRAEKMDSRIISMKNNTELKKSTFDLKDHDIRAIINSDAIFTDERYVPIQSLELWINNEEEPDWASLDS